MIREQTVERICLKGPDALVATVSKALIGGDFHIDVEPAETTDLLVQVNDQVLSTKISDWLRRIENELTP